MFRIASLLETVRIWTLSYLWLRSLDRNPAHLTNTETDGFASRVWVASCAETARDIDAIFPKFTVRDRTTHGHTHEIVTKQT